MGLEDKSIRCYDCGATFTFSAEEQESFRALGYVNDPKRCPACREARKARQAGNSGNGRGGPSQQRFAATCAECGRDCVVPFEPRAGRPVYCSDCYRRVRLGR